MFSIIIPAYNEEDVIAECLGALTQDLQPHEAEIIVVCNACKDRTAEIARGFAGVTVVETATPGKPNALNMADRLASHFPRIYVDADVRMSTQAARTLALALNDGRWQAAAPSLNVDLQGRSCLLRSYYRVWMRLPYVTQGMLGSGVYALSQAGRARFGDFPEVLAEDDLVRLTFAPQERIILTEHQFTITAPTTFRSLLMLRQRWERGNCQIDDRYAALRKNDRRDYGPFLRELVCSPTLWPAFAVYLFVLANSRMGALLQRRRRGNPMEWNRDDTARAAAKIRDRH